MTKKIKHFWYFGVSLYP